MLDEDYNNLDPANLLPKEIWTIEPTAEDLERKARKVYTGSIDKEFLYK